MARNSLSPYVYNSIYLTAAKRSIFFQSEVNFNIFIKEKLLQYG